jgi:CO/xanthine dehydrogenase FAD-binding subunit
MRPFSYARPTTLADALELLGEHGTAASLLAGGTDLVVALRNGTATPAMLIDVKGISELSPDIAESDGWLTIGATTVMTAVEQDARVRSVFPALADAAATVGSVQIRNRATVAGNICHASPAADTAPALLAYGAMVSMASPAGTRRVSLAEFFLGPGMTVVGYGELVISIELPLPSGPRGAAFARVTRRRGVDLATVNLCCVVDGAGVTRFAFGAVGPRPFVVSDESGVLADPAAAGSARDEALAQLLTHASPISDVRGSQGYRAAMLTVMSRRALQLAIARLKAA